MSGWNRRGSSTAWRRLRAFVLYRDGWTCQVPMPDGSCYPDGTARPICADYASTVGHLDARALGGPLLADPGRLRAECSAHNYAEGARLGNAMRRARRLGDRSWSW